MMARKVGLRSSLGAPAFGAAAAAGRPSGRKVSPTSAPSSVMAVMIQIKSTSAT